MKIKLSIFSMGLIVLAGLFSSCSVSKEAKGIKKTINGSWTLESINTEGLGVQGVEIKTKSFIFNEMDSKCFVGSTWNFIANNSMGSYTINVNAGNCVALTRNIRWSIYEGGPEKLFQFKRLDDRKNSLDDNTGFRLRITALDDNTMQLKSDNTFEGKTVTLVYNFVRN